MELSQKQKDLLGKYIDSYKDRVITEEWQQNLKDHEDHLIFFKEKLSLENIDKMTEEDFWNIYKKLRASNIWGNKDWYIQNKLLKPNGLDKIKEWLKGLLYGKETIDTRFDNFRNDVLWFWASALSELLNFFDPDTYCLRNDKPKSVLPFLGIDLLPERFFKYSLWYGKDYLACIQALALIKEELKNHGYENPNFIDLDCIFWHIFTSDDFKRVEKDNKKDNIKKDIVKNEVKPIITNKTIETHEEAEYYALKLGELMWYITYTVDYSKMYNGKPLWEYAMLQDLPDFAGQRDKNSAREIDVIRFDEWENPRYCIEVEHTTDITKGLNRLYQLEHFNVMFIIVSHEDRRNKFEIEMSKFPYRTLRNRYKFVSYEELIRLYELTGEYKSLKDRLFG